MRRSLGILSTVIGLHLALSGCVEWAYYQQAAVGQWELLQTRRAVAEVLTDPATDPSLRQQLETAQAIRAFASTELALPNNDSYRYYTDVQRPYMVVNVFAAPELSLEPRRWCFLMVGCLSYRGYFDAQAAQRLADALRAAGDDVYVAPISAYSTLGWFADPLANTFIHWTAGRLAELMFHELAHQRLYIADDTAFNEAFATAVGRLGAERWLAQWGEAREREQYAADRRRQYEFSQLVTTSRQSLAALYASTQSDTEKRANKQRILMELRAHYQELKRSWNGYTGYDRWFEQDLNNAKLAGHSAYHHWTPAFIALFEQEGRDFPAFYRAAEAIGQWPLAQRQAYLQALLVKARPSFW